MRIKPGAYSLGYINRLWIILPSKLALIQGYCENVSESVKCEKTLHLHYIVEGRANVVANAKLLCSVEAN